MSGQVWQVGKAIVEIYKTFEILKRVGTFSYRLALLPNLSGVHAVFHVSMLRNYTPDLTYVVNCGEIIGDVDGTFEEGLVRIMDNREQVL